MEKTPPAADISSQEEVKSILISSSNENPGCSSSTNRNEARSVPERSKAETPPPPPPPVSSPSTSRRSPDPCCAICLEQLQNKSYTNGCLHMFCFKCLVDWSKIKPVCPLCKQEFKSIIHNVQEDCKYDTYYLNNQQISADNFLNFSNGISNSIRINHQISSSNIPRFRYRTTLTADRIVERSTTTHQDTLQIQIENHRRRFAPHSVRLISTTQATNRVPSRFRARIYYRNLWVKPLQSSRFRIISPDFFKRNPACTHRLLPWLNRELIVLLHNVESRILDVLELIMALITRYDINSQEFYNHIKPYLHQRTAHFVHEFYHFASSPYNMDEYDNHATYDGSEPQPSNEVVDVEDPSNECMIIDQDEPSHNNTSESNAEGVQNTKKQKSRSSLNKKNTVEKVVLKRNRDTDSWVTVMGPLPLMHNYSVTNLNNYYSNPGPSNMSDMVSSSLDTVERPLVSPVHIEIESSDDEIEVLDVLKPKAERTPEIVDLSSDEEASNVAEENNNSLATLNSPALYRYSPVSPSYSPMSPDYNFPSPISPYSRDPDVQAIFGNSSSNNSDLVQETNSSINRILLTEPSDTDDDCIFESPHYAPVSPRYSPVRNSSPTDSSIDKVLLTEPSGTDNDCVYESTQKSTSTVSTGKKESEGDENNNANGNSLLFVLGSIIANGRGSLSPLYTPISPSYSPTSPSYDPILIPLATPPIIENSNSHHEIDTRCEMKSSNNPTLLEELSDTEDDCIYETTLRNVSSQSKGSKIADESNVNNSLATLNSPAFDRYSPVTPPFFFSSSSSSDIECVFDSSKTLEKEQKCNRIENHTNKNLPMDLSKQPCFSQESGSHNTLTPISKSKQSISGDKKPSPDSAHPSLATNSSSNKDLHADLLEKEIPKRKRKNKLSSQIVGKKASVEKKGLSKKRRSVSSKKPHLEAMSFFNKKTLSVTEPDTPRKPTKTYIPSKIVIPNSSSLNANNVSDSQNHEMSSTESCSETDMVQPPKKRKLRSVVATHIKDYIISDEQSDHKLHKSRKAKKKKKHSRRIKRPVSDSDSDS